MTGKITVIAYHRATASSLRPYPRREGLLNYDLHESPDDAPGVLVFLENRASKADLDAHLRFPHIDAFRGRAAGRAPQHHPVD
ncbi:MAG: antibiotic biosynthesis monooxygenase [Methyloceanibacter sp.]